MACCLMGFAADLSFDGWLRFDLIFDKKRQLPFHLRC